MLYVNPIAGAGGRIPASGAAREKAALRELEHYFAFTLLQEMRKSIGDGGLSGSGATRRLNDQLFDDAMARHIADSGQLGLARQIEAQLRASGRAAAPDA
jgi:Rod binding domain-containing protein